MKKIKIQKFGEKTANLNLSLSDESESYDIDVYNDNLDIIDNYLENYQKIDFWVKQTAYSGPTKYEAKDGMSWYNWSSSDYNSNSIITIDNKSSGIIYNNSYLITDYDTSEPLSYSSYIIDGKAYTYKKAITFSIDGDEMRAVEGMSFEEYFASDIYDRTYYSDGSHVYLSDGTNIYTPGTGDYLPSDAEISDGEAYSSESCCFEKGTQIQTTLNGESKNIEDIKAGDIIISYNEDIQEFFETKVLALKHNPSVTHVGIVTLENGMSVRMNAYHPLLTINGYKSLTKYEGLPLLTKDDIIITTQGNSKIKSIEEYNQEEEYMYNLTIDDKYHNYVANGIVAHNAPSPC